MSNVERRFPDGFVWGTATASYQIEGAVNEDGRGESIWDRFSHTPGKVVNGDTGDVACDHYHRWQGDIELMVQLGVNAYRFSVAWPRVLPAGRGAGNEAGLAFYDRLVDGLLAAGITPWITLYHWDLPQVLEDEGGWPERATADAFAEYTDVVTRRLGDRVKAWITLNEPWCSAFLGYQLGQHAPGRTDFAASLQALHTLFLAHGRAMEVIRRNVPDAQAGITLNLQQVYPATESEADRAAARRLDGYGTRWFLDPLYGRGYPEDMLTLYGNAAPLTQPGDFETIAAPTDFLGLNYYTRAIVEGNPHDGPIGIKELPPVLPVTGMGWEIYPDGLYELLVRVQRDYGDIPILVTENGAAYDDPAPTNGVMPDPGRRDYLREHLAAVARAAEAGVNVQGYFAWSLLDNFEWEHGYDKRFGIVYVDYETQRRIPKQSALWYRDLIAARAPTR